jgi:hypothetical protein
MAFFQPKKRIYIKPIDLDSQPCTWISKHRGFANREWIEGQIRYGQWINEKSNPNQFRIYATNIDGIKPLTIIIKIREYETHVLVYHVHVLRKKR